jgi:Protein of unknown function, DUF538
MGDAAGTTLTLEQVTQIISQAKSAGASPMLSGIQIFSSLGANVTVPGDTMRLALTTSGIPITGPLVPLVNAIESVSKTGEHLSIALNQDTETLLNNNRVRFKQEVSFDVNETVDAPALNNIVGVAAHKLLSWINIQSVQLKQDQGRWSVAVGTSLTTINFDLN